MNTHRSTPITFDEFELAVSTLAATSPDAMLEFLQRFERIDTAKLAAHKLSLQVRAVSRIIYPNVG